MKNTILTVLTLFAFLISNAQVKTKANHHTTRSNQSQGIMVIEDNRDNDCDGVIDSKLFVKITKRGLPNLHFHCCNAVEKSKESIKKAHANKHLFINKSVTYYYNGNLDKLNKCIKQQSQQKTIGCNGVASSGCIYIGADCLEMCNFIDVNASKRKKRNKNFNRKGERIKRTKF